MANSNCNNCYRWMLPSCLTVWCRILPSYKLHGVFLLGTFSILKIDALISSGGTVHVWVSRRYIPKYGKIDNHPCGYLYLELASILPIAENSHVFNGTSEWQRWFSLFVEDTRRLSGSYIDDATICVISYSHTRHSSACGSQMDGISWYGFSEFYFCSYT
jgi:hypothetical protein